MAMVAAVAEIYARHPRPVPPEFPYPLADLQVAIWLVDAPGRKIRS